MMLEESMIESPKTDFFIRLPSEADLQTVFNLFYTQDTSTSYDEEGNVVTENIGDPYLVTHTHDYAIDLVGVIYEPTGNTLTDDEGNEYPETAPVDGWHVNIRLVGDARREDVEAIDAVYGLIPNSPSRVFL